MITRCSIKRGKTPKGKIAFKYHICYKNVLKKENTCVIALVIFDENITMNPIKVY